MAHLHSYTSKSPSNYSFVPVVDAASPAVATAETFEVPVAVSISMSIELLCSEPCLDLEAAAAVVLSDVGATLRVFHAVADECGGSAAVPFRISECIVLLGKSGLLRAFTPAYTRVTAVQSSFLQRCLNIALAARTVAVAFPGVELEQAYMAGMLSELAQFPAVFPEWRIAGRNPVEVLTQEWALPVSLAGCLSGEEGSEAGLLSRVVAIAREAVTLDMSQR